ncbi:DUF6470 family protein [Paenibacillus senegalensis]|uniref:DUF6470 family protein n=1 Tax=Paenibacillus senegalensis TaxID=1465766 RepID=UPI0002881CF1|nr:DUF6470 family protein [Paenibacillus senegalensis]
MMPLPVIEIRQQHAKLGMQSELGRNFIKQSRADMEIHTTRPELVMESSRSELTIDQGSAWASLGKDHPFNLNQRIYSQCQDIVLQGIARRVEEGNRMAAIHTGEHVFAELARERAFQEAGIEPRAPLAYPSVAIEYKPGNTSIQVKEGSYQLHVQPHRPQIDYEPGKLNIYMLQYQSVEIIPPKIDIKQ